MVYREGLLAHWGAPKFRGGAEYLDKFCKNVRGKFSKLSIDAIQFFLFIYHSGFSGNIDFSEYVVIQNVGQWLMWSPMYV